MSSDCLPRMFGVKVRLAASLAALCFICACATTPAIVGRWESLDGPGNVTFNADGTFTATDNQGMPVEGTYRLSGPDGVRFEIVHANQATESIAARMAQDGDRMTLVFPEQDAVENYRRLP